MRRYTLAEARFILTHVFCVGCLPAEGSGMLYRYDRMFGEARCTLCPCAEPADLRLYVPTNATAEAWLVTENACVDAFNAKVA